MHLHLNLNMCMGTCVYLCFLLLTHTHTHTHTHTRSSTAAEWSAQLVRQPQSKGNNCVLKVKVTDPGNLSHTEGQEGLTTYAKRVLKAFSC